jgi:uncharacterized protein (DUF1800 family)
MTLSRREFLKAMSAATAATAIPPALTWGVVEQNTPPSDPDLHLLNRITWGPRPADLARIRQIGQEAYLDEQLDPDKLDDSALDERLKSLPILFMKRREAHRLVDREYRAFVALTQGMVQRAVYSQRQLFERMVEFWADHFNMPDDELGPDLVTYHREVLRRHALGNFRDLLIGTAQNPAMLYYLNNAESDAKHPNENFARELMELHTLGVDGGYTEKDVKAVARAFTGWTVNNALPDGFYFNPEMHDTGSKEVLGHQLPAERGIEDGLHVLSILVNRPATARYLCQKLCVRFVSDQPPISLVESAAAVWIAHEGAIRPVLRHILLSDEFRQSVGQKLRRPLDFFIGALRATGTEIQEFSAMEEMLRELAQVPYGWHPPNGYPDVAPAWMTSAGLLARWNVAQALTHGAYSIADSKMTTQLEARIGQPQTVGALVEAVAEQVFVTPLPPAMRAALVDFAADGAGSAVAVTPHLLARKLGALYGLMLASPLYQWR